MDKLFESFIDVLRRVTMLSGVDCTKADAAPADWLHSGFGETFNSRSNDRVAEPLCSHR